MRGKASDGAGQSGRDRTDEDVAIAHVAEFMSEHAFQFIVVEQSEDALGYGDGSVVRIASGGEGVGRIGRDDIDLGHRQADFLRQALDDVVDARQIFAADGLGAIGGERDLVGEKVGNEIQDGGEGQRHQHSVLAAESAPGQHEQQRHGGEQERGFEYVAHNDCLSVIPQ